MQTSTPQLTHICTVAIDAFAHHGLHPAAMEQVAADVGLSLDALRRYFPDAAALYAQAFRESAREESIYSRAVFDAEPVHADPGSLYCQLLPVRFDDSPHLRFLLRAAYQPPPELRSALAPRFQAFLDDVAVGIRSKVSARTTPRSSGHDAPALEMLYLDVLDGVFRSLLNGVDPKIHARLEALAALVPRPPIHRRRLAPDVHLVLARDRL